METKDIPIGQLKPSGYNPREISKHDFEALRRSIRKFGFVEPIVVNRYAGRENVVIGGHQRLKAAQAENLPTVPVIFVSLDPNHERVLNLALNRITGQWVEPQLADVFKLLNQIGDGVEMDLTGFNPEEISNLIEHGTRFPDLDEEGGGSTSKPNTGVKVKLEMPISKWKNTVRPILLDMAEKYQFKFTEIING